MSDAERLDPAQHPWLQKDALRCIFRAIRAAGGEARVVGGAVRDSLLGRPVNEFDMAVNLPPEKVMGALTAAKIKVVPTGIDHGTVTAVIDHKGYELTTLRHDLETDGRHAKVAFTDDWQADAARRDFTMNALYVDEAGKIYDYFDGRKDLKEGRVRFIGEARARIQEDHLRILRFFRFYSCYGKGAADEIGLVASKELASLIPTLSAERIWREVIKLLGAGNPLPTWKLMIDNDVLSYTLPQALNISRLENLLALEKQHDREPSALVRLAALLPKDAKAASTVAEEMKLSKREAETLQILAILPDQLKGKLDPVPFRSKLYEHGVEVTEEAALLLATEDRSADIKTALEVASLWDSPSLPIQGEDILRLGVAAGPKVGQILRHVEAWWMIEDFRPNRDECLSEARKHIA
ncbi:MAG: CCA tRNA nucleotidyltransferase [Alphaproteobacteria bacterium]